MFNLIQQRRQLKNRLLHALASMMLRTKLDEPKRFALDIRDESTDANKKATSNEVEDDPKLKQQ